MNILLAVCGSISFYKAFEILSELKRLDINVRVMLSGGAAQFVSEIGFEALSGFRVLSDKNSEPLDHINWARWADAILVAPASANTINKMATGIADCVFMQTLLAAKTPIIIAPAANEAMLNNFATKKNLAFLKENKIFIVEPETRVLACKEFGAGALANPHKIAFIAAKAANKDSFYKDKKVVITGGATTEKIDDARGITNFSSGKMARALADAFYLNGADVVLIASFEAKNAPYEVRSFKSSEQLATQMAKIKCDLLVMAAAVSDFVPASPQTGKIKKAEMAQFLELKANIDILKSIKNADKKIGFKMEMDAKTAENSARRMLNDKKLDAVCLNILGQNGVEFGSDMSDIFWISGDKDSEIKSSGVLDKAKIAQKIAIWAKELF